MGKQMKSRRGFRDAVAIVMLGGLMAACSGIRGDAAGVFMKGGAPGGAATGPGPAIAGRAPAVAGSLPATAMPRETRQVTVQRGQSIGSLAGEYHVSKQAIIAANHLEAPYKIKIGTRVTIPGAAAPAVQQAMVPPSASAAATRDMIPLDDPPAPPARAPPPAAPPAAATLPPPRAPAPAPLPRPAPVAAMPPPSPPPQPQPAPVAAP